MPRVFASRGLHVLILMGLLTGAAVVQAQDYQWAHSLRFIAFDAFNRIHPRQPTDKVAIVDIDETSMGRQDLGQWPWPRTTVAKMVDQLASLGAKAIVFDVVFAESDRTSPPVWVKTLNGGDIPADLREKIATLQDHDATLARSFQNAANVVAGFVWSGDRNATRHPPVLSKPIMLSPGASGLDKNANLMEGVTTTIPLLSEAAAGNGCFGVSTEFDGLIRQVPLLFGFDAPGKGVTLYPSLAIEALRVAQDPKSSIAIRRLGPNEMGEFEEPYRMKIGSYQVPLGDDGRFFVYFSKERTKTYIPAWKVLDGKVDPTAIKDKIVLIGTSAEGLKDIRSTPLDLFIPGVEVHVNVIEQILTGQFLLRPKILAGVELIVTVLPGLAVILLAPAIGAALLAGLTIMILLGELYASWLLYFQHGLLFDPVYPGLAVGLIFIATSLLSYMRTEAEKRHVRNAFSHYISPEFMTELTNNPDKLRLGGEVRELSVMFTDIRGFTSISERLSPEALIQLMNDFLTPMSALVMENRGTIDKYMGDAMMAFWNAPLDDPHHARHACLTALKMNAALDPINARLEQEAGENSIPLKIAAGIGINTGLAAVGNMGSRQRFAYSALGDAVNLASRLEGQTKIYGVTILLSENTADHVRDLALLELDLIRVKGKSDPVRVYTILGDEKMAGSDSFQVLTVHHQEMIAAYRQGEFAAAESSISTLLTVAPSNLHAFYQMMLTRIEELKLSRPNLEEWDGVYNAKTK